MKTPSFGNNSGHDDQYTLFKESQRREKGLEIEAPSTTRRIPEHSDLVREIEYSRVKKMEKNLDSKSTILEDSKEHEHEDSLLQYASMMGHKKRLQGLKKGSIGSLNSSKGSINQYFKPRSSLRNLKKLPLDTNSKTFLGSRNYEKTDAKRQPNINYDELAVKQDSSLEKSQAR